LGLKETAQPKTLRGDNQACCGGTERKIGRIEKIDKRKKKKKRKQPVGEEIYKTSHTALGKKNTTKGHPKFTSKEQNGTSWRCRHCKAKIGVGSGKGAPKKAAQDKNFYFTNTQEKKVPQRQASLRSGKEKSNRIDGLTTKRRKTAIQIAERKLAEVRRARVQKKSSSITEGERLH